MIIQYTVQYSSVLCIQSFRCTVQYSTVQYSTVQYSTVSSVLCSVLVRTRPFQCGACAASRGGGRVGAMAAEESPSAASQSLRAASQGGLVSASAKRVLALSKGRMRVPLEDLGPALFNRQGLPTCGRHCNELGKRIVQVEGFATFRYDFGYCHEPDPANQLAVSEHGNKMADRDPLLPRLGAKPLKGVFAKTHLVTWLQLLKVGRQPELWEQLAKQRSANGAASQDELQDTLENGIFMHVFPWSAVRDHKDDIVALMASDNFDHGHGLADSELRCVKSVRTALLTLEVPPAGSATGCQWDVVRDHVQRLAGQRWHARDLTAFWEFAKTTMDTQLDLMMEIWVFAECESVLKVESNFFGYIAKLPAKMQWTRTALCVAQFLSDEKECTAVGGRLVAGSVSRSCIAKLASKSRTEDQKAASQDAEHFLDNLMTTYYMPWAADQELLPFNRQAWTKSLAQILAKAGKHLAADKAFDTDLKAKWEIRIRKNLEVGLHGAMPQRITAASEAEVAEATPLALESGIVKANASGEAQVPVKRLAIELGLERHCQVIRKSARIEKSPMVGVLQEVSDAGVAVEWAGSGIELMQMEDVMPWTPKKDKPVENAVFSLPGIKWSPTSNNHNAEMVLHLAKVTLYQVYVSQSAAHNEIHVVSQDKAASHDSAASQDKAASQSNVAVFARKDFKAGVLSLLPFNTELVDGACKRPAGAVPLEMVITPDGEKATRVAFWVKPIALPNKSAVNQQKAVVMVPFWIMAKSSQEPKKVAEGRGASQEYVAATQGVQNEHLIYKIAEFDVQAPSAIARGGRNIKSKVAMRIPYLTNDMSLAKGARLLVKGNLPAALEDTT